jgi:iron donor protein CyaY
MSTPNDFIEEGPFRDAVKIALVRLLEQIDNIESDEHDPSMTDGNLKVVFEDDSTFILSQQPPTREFWLSANFTAWHFLCSGGVWVERDTSEPMTAVLSKLFSDKLEMNIRLTL